MSCTDDIERAYQLLPAYIENPELALSVREFATGFNRCAISGTFPRLSDIEHAAVENHVAELGLGAETTRAMLESLGWRRRGTTGLDWRVPVDPNASSWEREEEAHQQYGIFAGTVTALLLSLCRNINTLYFKSAVCQGPLRDYLLASNYGLTPRPALQGLRHVAYCARWPEDERYYEDVDILDILRCVHRLPQVESLSMDGVTEGEREADEPFPPKTSRSLRRIHLGNMDMHPDLVHTIVRIPVALEELSLSFGGMWCVGSHGANVDPATLAKALRQHKETLRVLDLDMGSAYITDHGARRTDDEQDFDTENEYYQMDLAASEGPLYAYELENDHETLAIGSLRDYTALTRMSISIELLTTSQTSAPHDLERVYKSEFRLIDTLPPNLEYLCLYGYEKGTDLELDDHVAELIDNKSERLPKLKEIVGVDKLEPGILVSRANGRSYGSEPEETLWQRPDDGLDGKWVEE